MRISIIITLLFINIVAYSQAKLIPQFSIFVDHQNKEIHLNKLCLSTFQLFNDGFSKKCPHETTGKIFNGLNYEVIKSDGQYHNIRYLGKGIECYFIFDLNYFGHWSVLYIESIEMYHFASEAEYRFTITDLKKKYPSYKGFSW